VAGRCRAGVTLIDALRGVRHAAGWRELRGDGGWGNGERGRRGDEVAGPRAEAHVNANPDPDYNKGPGATHRGPCRLLTAVPRLAQ